ncbi:aminoglycoside phosphotransferase family protein [Paenibacillus alkalitolerans]|uniref:aminoglycoside phosphotransferase family protein n=1 Tax=Paenibacillus alkalitolerans TaxID=2799335 RepID=UPI0018F408CF|nr:aminoglycoside phosphotransferase family protein [Paenibacillus alkalitolerans]
MAVFTLLPPFYEKPPFSDANIFLERIAQEFSILIERYAYLKDAFDHDVFIVNEELVFRFPRTRRDTDYLPYEIAFLNDMKDKMNVVLPDYSFIPKSGDFAGYKIIPGTILAPWIFKNLNRKDKEAAVTQLIEFINRFHHMDLHDFAQYQPREREDFIAIEQRIEKELVEKLFPKLPCNEVEIIKNFYIEAHELFQDIPNRCATHGDLYAFNVLWDRDTSQIGVIDFSDLLIGDPAKDFEVFYDYGREYAEMAYQLYTGPKDQDFLRRVETYYKLHAIYTLLSSQLGALITFEHAHLRFRQKFHL